MQTLRGRVHAVDGTFSRQRVPGGLHVEKLDASSWHLLMLDSGDSGEVLGCVRWRVHDPRTSFGRLAVRHGALARCGRWGKSFRRAVEHELKTARGEASSYIEAGGWVLDESIRSTTETVRGMLLAFAWTRLVGGARGLTTAMLKDGSAAILRRLGGKPLECDGKPIPSYFDRDYNCRMEVLRFTADSTDPKFEPVVQALQDEMRSVPVIYGNCAAHVMEHAAEYEPISGPFWDPLLAAA